MMPKEIGVVGNEHNAYLDYQMLTHLKTQKHRELEAINKRLGNITLNQKKELSG